MPKYINEPLTESWRIMKKKKKSYSNNSDVNKGSLNNLPKEKILVLKSHKILLVREDKIQSPNK